MAKLILIAALTICTACVGGGEKKQEPTMSVSKSAAINFTPIQPGTYYVEVNPEPGVVPEEVEGNPPQLYWIRTDAAWKRLGFKKLLPPSANPSAEEAAVRGIDFQQHDVLMLTMGVQGTTGYAMQLESIEGQGSDFRFLLETKKPKPTDAVGEALTNPTVTIRVNKIPQGSKLHMVMDGKDAAFDLRVLE